MPSCSPCKRAFGSLKALAQHTKAKHPEVGYANEVERSSGLVEVIETGDPRMKPDWSGRCEVCGMTPILPLTGMCGPCTFGEADTMNGNWF